MKLVYATFPGREALEEVRDAVLEEKLAVCANLFKTDSAFLWEGYIKEEGELVAFFKTTKEKADDLKQKIEDLHPYEVPCVLEIPVEANESYEEYMEGEI